MRYADLIKHRVHLTEPSDDLKRRSDDFDGGAADMRGDNVDLTVSCADLKRHSAYYGASCLYERCCC